MPAKIKIDAMRLSSIARGLTFRGIELKENKAETAGIFDSFVGFAKGDKCVIFQADDESPTVLHKGFYKKITVVEDGLIWCAALDKLESYAKSFDGEVTVTFGKSIVIEKGKHKKSFANVVVEECTAAKRAKAMFDMLVVEQKDVKDKDGNEFNIVVDTTAEEIENIVKDVRLVGGTFFPICIEIDEGKPSLVIHVKNSTDSSERPLSAEISGITDEFRNDYSFGFHPVFSNIEGKVELRFSKTLPLMIVKSENENEAHRFVIANKASEEEEENEPQSGEPTKEDEKDGNKEEFEDIQEEGGNGQEDS